MGKKETDELEAALTAARPRTPAVPPEDFLSTGCTLLNLGLSGTVSGGVPKGCYLYLVGDSGAGKTWWTFCLFAEAARNKHFAGYRFVYDNAENGALMDVERYFGAGVLSRLEPPAHEGKNKPLNSRTVQEFYYNLENAVRAGPCIYVLDSMDALNDDADEAKFEAELKHYNTGKGEVPGSMGMAKAKTNSRNINRVAQTLRGNGSILAVISQTRDKLGTSFPMKTRGGGHALKFYAHLEVWLKVKGPLMTARSVRGKEREIGSVIGGDVQKNRVCGWEGRLPLINFIKGYGVDDLGSNVEYLLDERHWKKTKADAKSKAGVSFDDEEEGDGGGKTFAAPEFEFTGTAEQLVKVIQDADEEWKLARLCGTVWHEILDAATPQRKARYT